MHIFCEFVLFRWKQNTSHIPTCLWVSNHSNRCRFRQLVSNLDSQRLSCGSDENVSMRKMCSKEIPSDWRAIKALIQWHSQSFRMSLFKYLKEIEPNADVVTIRVCFGWDFSDLIPSAFPKVANSTNSFEWIYYKYDWRAIHQFDGTSTWAHFDWAIDLFLRMHWRWFRTHNVAK